MASCAGPWALAHTHLPHAAHDAELLCVDEALQHHADGHVDIIFYHIVTQVDSRMGLRHADHGLDVPHRDGDAACCLEGRMRQALSARRGNEQEMPHCWRLDLEAHPAVPLQQH